MRRIGAVLLVAVTFLVFQNCALDGAPVVQNQQTNSSTAGQSPQPGPTPAQTPVPQPAPTPPPAPPPPPAQPTLNLNGAIAEVGMPVAGTAAQCAAGFTGVQYYTLPVGGGVFNFNSCIKYYQAGSPNIVTDIQMVAGEACPAEYQLLNRFEPNRQNSPLDFGNPRWLLINSVCFRTMAVGGATTKVSGFYLSGANAACGAGHVQAGSGVFCTVGNSGGQCLSPVEHRFCRF